VIRAHRDAVLALLAPLTTDPAVGFTVAVGALDDAGKPALDPVPPVTPYAVLRIRSRMTSDRLVPWHGRFDATVYLTHCGRTEDEAAWAQERTRALLLDAVPAVTGRVCAPLAMLDSQPIHTDRDVSPPLFYGVDVYTVYST